MMRPLSDPAGRRFHHVALVVTDPDTAFAFSRDVPGLDPVERPDGADLPGSWFQHGDGQVHLFQPPDPLTRPPHFAIEVHDLAATVASIRDRGITVYDIEHRQGFGYQVLVVDPSGNLIELNQPD
jgi:lactoylglutathione lyase